MGGSGSSMRLTIIGIGYLGLTHAVCMAELGHDVVALDSEAHKLAQASSGRCRSLSLGSRRCFGRTSMRAGCASRPPTPSLLNPAMFTSCV